jgi:nucleoid DNA-binding protein
VDLANYLKFLLYNHDSIHIPGLGILITRYKHAEIDASEKTISPPSKYLIFDSNSTKTDNLLVNHISALKHIEKKEADQELKKIIDDLKNKLDQGGTVLLEGIGYFSKEEGKIRFEKEQGTNFLTESFGLTEIDFEPVEMELSPHTPAIIDSKSKKSYSTLILLSILIIIIGGGVVIYLNFPDILNFHNPKLSQPIIKTVSDTIKNKTAAKDTSAKKTDIEEFFESTTDKKNALSIPNEKKEKNNKYYIIAGSFLTQAKAEILAKEIEKDGYKTQIIKFGPKYRISLGEYTDKDKAVIEMEKIRNTKGDNTVWLLTGTP